MPLKDKIEPVLDKVLWESIKKRREEVEIIPLDESESDDDY